MPEPNHDVIVVGARCAGASTALLLSRAGLDVLLLDAAAEVTEALSTRYIHQPGVAYLARWGVLDGLLSSGCPRLETMSHRIGDVTVAGRLPAAEGIGFGIAPRRAVLDQALVDAAGRAGATFLPGQRVVDLVWENGTVAGVTWTSAGRVTTRRARLVVGADGMRSTVARLVGATSTVDDGRRSCVYYSPWRGLAAGLGFVEDTDRYLATIPSHDGVTLVATYLPQSRFRDVRQRAADVHLSVVGDLAPDLAEAMAAGCRVDRLRGTGDQRNFFRRATGPGWALVGDAGHHKDSITARGITDAFRQSELLARCVADEPALPDGLAGFERRRDALLADGYASTLVAADLEVSDRRVAMMRVIARSVALTDTYLRVVAGLGPVTDLMVPEVVSAIGAR